MGSARIGLCEDDANLRSVLERTLRGESFEVRSTITGHQAVEVFAEDAPDLLVLDVGLPDADGRDVCQALRARGVGAPVLFLTAHDELTDRLAGFHAGGDDYLGKPFAIPELLARIHALLRRAAKTTPGSASEPSGLELDPATHSIRLGPRSVSMTPTEYRILGALIAGQGEVLRRSQLVATAWPEGAIVHDNTLDTYIRRLRAKLRAIESPQAIETLRGVGYLLR